MYGGDGGWQGWRGKEIITWSIPKHFGQWSQCWRKASSFPALSLWAAQEVVFDEAIWRPWRGLVWGKLSYSWRIGVRLILLLLYSPPPTSQAPQPTCSWRWHSDTCQLGNPATTHPPTYLYRYHHHQTSPVLHYTQEHSQWHFCQSLFFFDPKYSIHVNFVESLSNQRRVDAAMYFNNHVWLWALFLIKFDQHTHTHAKDVRISSQWFWKFHTISINTWGGKVFL